MAAGKLGSSTKGYRLHVWLRGISPMIWRRLLVRADSTIADLHYVLQIAFGWTDSHLHSCRLPIKARTESCFLFNDFPVLNCQTGSDGALVVPAADVVVGWCGLARRGHHSRLWRILPPRWP